jgi:hypothetical protein
MCASSQTRARQCRPPENGGNPLSRRQSQGVERLAGAVLDRAFAAEFTVPDAQLPVEIPETRERDELDAIRRRRRPHGQERPDDLHVQGAGRVLELLEVGPGLPSQLVQREFQGRLHSPLSYRTAGPVFLRN